MTRNNKKENQVECFICRHLCVQYHAQSLTVPPSLIITTCKKKKLHHWFHRFEQVRVSQMKRTSTVVCCCECGVNKKASADKARSCSEQRLCVCVRLWVKLGIRAEWRGECLHSVWVSAQCAASLYVLTETAIKEYPMWKQGGRESLRGQKECDITVAFSASGCYLVLTISTNSIQKYSMRLHTHNPERGEKAGAREQEAHNN